MVDHSICCGARIALRRNLVQNMAHKFHTHRASLRHSWAESKLAVEQIPTDACPDHVRNFRTLADTNAWVARRVDRMLADDERNITKLSGDPLNSQEKKMLKWQAFAYYVDRKRRVRQYFSEMKSAARRSLAGVEVDRMVGKHEKLVKKKRKQGKRRKESLLRREVGRDEVVCEGFLDVVGIGQGREGEVNGF